MEETIETVRTTVDGVLDAGIRGIVETEKSVVTTVEETYDRVKKAVTGDDMEGAAPESEPEPE